MRCFFPRGETSKSMSTNIQSGILLPVGELFDCLIWNSFAVSCSVSSSFQFRSHRHLFWENCACQLTADIFHICTICNIPCFSDLQYHFYSSPLPGYKKHSLYPPMEEIDAFDEKEQKLRTEVEPLWDPHRIMVFMHELQQ